MTQNVAVAPQLARGLVDEALREFPRGGKLNLWQGESQHSAGGLTQHVRNLANRRQISTDGAFWVAVAEHIWSLARIGALALLPQDPQTVGGEVPQEQRQIPTFVVTELGARLLAEPDFSPHDCAKYKAATLVRVESPDDVVLVHLHEAVEARRGALYRASLVMLGAACERLILLLADAVILEAET
jgi:hypothetical protein